MGVENSISATDWLAIISSIFAIVLSVVAIALTIVFYRFSSAIERDIRTSADSIRSGVDKLKALFSRMYIDTFSIMRDTVEDVRRHAWPITAGKMPDEQGETALSRNPPPVIRHPTAFLG